MAETFKLPCSSYEELIKLFQAYANTKEGTALSLDEITQATGVPRTIVSKNNGFMVQVGLITEGKLILGQWMFVLSLFVRQMHLNLF